MIPALVNPDYKTHFDGPLLVIDDFLLNIDEFRESLRARGGFSHNRRHTEVVDIGPTHDWRQIVSATEFPEEFNAHIARLQTAAAPAKAYGTNLFYSDMQIENRKRRNANRPHTDYAGARGPLPVVFNLWLHDGGGGTGFYSYDDHFTSSAMTPDLRYFAENYQEGDNRGLSTFESEFEGDSAWRLWKVAAMKKNRAFVYCGDLWHRVLIPPGEFTYPNARFSFVAFGAAPSDEFLKASGTKAYLQGPINASRAP